MLTESEFAIVSGGINTGDVIEYTCGALGAVLFYIPYHLSGVESKLLKRAETHQVNSNCCNNKIDEENGKGTPDKLQIQCLNISKKYMLLEK